MSRSRSRSRSPPRADSRSASPAGRSASPPRRSPRRSPERAGRGGSPDGDGQANLYITGLAARVTDDDLIEHFKGEGKIKHARVVCDPRSHESRGFGFVLYEDPRDAEAAVKYLDRSVLKGRVIMVSKARRDRPRTPTPGAYRGVRTLRDATIVQERRDRDRGGSRDRYEPRDRHGRDDRDDRRRRRSPSPYRRRSRSPPPRRRRSRTPTPPFWQPRRRSVSP